MGKEIPMLAVTMESCGRGEKNLLSLESIQAKFLKEEVLDLKETGRKTITELGLNDSEILTWC